MLEKKKLIVDLCADLGTLFKTACIFKDKITVMHIINNKRFTVTLDLIIFLIECNLSLEENLAESLAHNLTEACEESVIKLNQPKLLLAASKYGSISLLKCLLKILNIDLFNDCEKDEILYSGKHTVEIIKLLYEYGFRASRETLDFFLTFSLTPDLLDILSQYHNLNYKQIFISKARMRDTSIVAWFLTQTTQSKMICDAINDDHLLYYCKNEIAKLLLLSDHHVFKNKNSISQYLGSLCESWDTEDLVNIILTKYISDIEQPYKSQCLVNVVVSGYITNLELFLSRFHYDVDELSLIVEKAYGDRDFYARSDIIETLCDYGLTDNCKNKVILDCACKTSNSKVVKMLLDDPNIDPCAENYKALRTSFKCRNSTEQFEVIKLFLNNPKVDPYFENGFLLTEAVGLDTILFRRLIEECSLDLFYNDNAVIKYAERKGSLSNIKFIYKDSKVKKMLNLMDIIHNQIKAVYGTSDIINWALKKLEKHHQLSQIYIAKLTETVFNSGHSKKKEILTLLQSYSNF
jgi:hypothetical protein